MRAAVAVALLIVVTPAARADDKEVARAAYAEGTKYYDLNKFEEALKAFEKAYWNYEEPAFLYNIAQCYRQLDRKAEAVQFYRSYLRKVPDTPNRAEVERLIASLEAAIAQERPATTPVQPAPAPRPSPRIAQPAPAPATVAVSAIAEQRSPPFYKHWWFWTPIAVVVAGGAITAAVLATRPAPSWSNVSDFGPGSTQRALVRW